MTLQASFVSLHWPFVGGLLGATLLLWALVPGSLLKPVVMKNRSEITDQLFIRKCFLRTLIPKYVLRLKVVTNYNHHQLQRGDVYCNCTLFVFNPYNNLSLYKYHRNGVFIYEFVYYYINLLLYQFIIITLFQDNLYIIV